MGAVRKNNRRFSSALPPKYSAVLPAFRRLKILSIDRFLFIRQACPVYLLWSLSTSFDSPFPTAAPPPLVIFAVPPYSFISSRLRPSLFALYPHPIGLRSFLRSISERSAGAMLGAADAQQGGRGGYEGFRGEKGADVHQGMVGGGDELGRHDEAYPRRGKGGHSGHLFVFVVVYSSVDG